jgi:Phage integrase family
MSAHRHNHAGEGLHALALTPPTRHHYASALLRLLQFRRLTLPQLLARSSVSIDQLVADYLNHLFCSGGSFTQAAHALFGLVHEAPRLRLKLHLARRSLKGWDRHRAHRSHPPLTWELTVAIALAMARRGHHAAATATVLAFDCYLRISEFSQLRRADIASAHDDRLGVHCTDMALRLANTKTGPNRFVAVMDLHVAAAVQGYLDSTTAVPADQRVFGFTRDQYRRLFSSVCLDLGLSGLGYVPHSLRHGGATADFMLGSTIEQIMHRGRWAATSSAARYIQQGPALLVSQQVPPDLVTIGRVCAPHLAECLRHLRESVAAATFRPPRRVRFGPGGH